MTAPENLRISFEPLNDEPRQFVIDGLNSHNIAASGATAWYQVRYYLRTPDGEVLGGLLGEIWARWLHIKIVWVDEIARGQGHATAMVRDAEAYAAKRGCHGAHLETFSFQARPLYEKLGYTVFGQLDDYPPGHVQYFMKKRFA